MQLLPLAKLQPVFKMPQKCVCGVQLMKIVPGDMALIVQLLQGKQCSAGT